MQLAAGNFIAFDIWSKNCAQLPNFRVREKKWYRFEKWGRKIVSHEGLMPQNKCGYIHQTPRTIPAHPGRNLWPYFFQLTRQCERKCTDWIHLIKINHKTLHSKVSEGAWSRIEKTISLFFILQCTFLKMTFIKKTSF